MARAYYNEIDPYAVQWLRNLIAAGHLPPGEVDERDIREVAPGDLVGFDQCHFFAGIGGMPYGLRLTGVPDDFPIWTGGFPCQPFSVAGRQRAQSDDRHLWPEFARLIASQRPAWLLGENVAGIIPLALDGVLADLESAGYACRPLVVPACAVDAKHRRDRVWIVAHALGGELRDEPGRRSGARRQGPTEPGDDGATCALADPDCAGPHATAQPGIHREEAGSGPRHGEPERLRGPQPSRPLADAIGAGLEGRAGLCRDDADELATAERGGAHLHNANRRSPGRPPIARQERCEWEPEPRICRVAHGVPARVAKLRAFGNAVVPQVVAEIGRAILMHDMASDSSSELRRVRAGGER